MSLFRSSPDGYARLGWRKILVVSASFCLAPAALGAGLSLIQAKGAALPMLLMLSPLVTAGFWMLISLGSYWGLRYSIWGAFSAILLGALAGWATLPALDPFSLMILGAIFATFHRFVLALIRPLAF